MLNYFRELVAKNENDYVIKQADTSFGALEHLIDFEIISRKDNKK